MIEAVNSVLQTAPFVRQNAEQTSTSDSLAANPDRVQRTPQGPRAPFVSPFIHVDVNFDKAVIQLRNGDTGDVVEQFPSESTLQARARQAARNQVAAETPSAPQVQSEQTAAAPRPQAQAASSEANNVRAAINAQQQAAFQAAAQTGVSNAGNVTLFA